jgi:WhiB family transcriptional regulator, redox-sensing transcriptional regulator
MITRSALQWSPGAAGPLLHDDPRWQDQSLCAETDPDAFFPEKGGSTAAAKRVCRACPVRSECLEYALANDERFGVWGGMSERERRRVDRAVTSVPRRCLKDLHVMTAENTNVNGKCRACRNAADRQARARRAEITAAAALGVAA